MDRIWAAACSVRLTTEESWLTGCVDIYKPRYQSLRGVSMNRREIGCVRGRIFPNAPVRSEVADRKCRTRPNRARKVENAHLTPACGTLSVTCVCHRTHWVRRGLVVYWHRYCLVVFEFQCGFAQLPLPQEWSEFPQVDRFAWCLRVGRRLVSKLTQAEGGKETPLRDVGWFEISECEERGYEQRRERDP